MAWAEKRLVLVLLMWMKTLIFLLWYVIKKRERDRHFRKAAHQKIRVWTELQAQME